MAYFHLKIRAVDPWLLLVIAIGAGVRLSRLDDFDNQYYTATVASMLQSAANFLFASFDPGGAVMVDKPPVSFWIQSIPSAFFGVSRWTVNVPQIVAGTLSIFLLYIAIKPDFGRVAALSAALLLALIPSSILIDSRNEPDSLVSFLLLLAAFGIIRTVKTGKWVWLILFALFVGLAFNTKMLVAFVPLPAFLLYQVLATNKPIRSVLLRSTLATSIVVIVSLSWMSVVALTPAENRPYIGSTRDNSIWTLAFKYNGMDRFTSFVGPRRREPIPPFQAGDPNQGIPQSQLGLPDNPLPPLLAGTLNQPALPSQPNVPNQPIPLIATTNQNQIGTLSGPSDIQETGLLSLLTNPLAGQLGWLLPLGLFGLAVVMAPLLPERVYRHPTTFFVFLKESPHAPQSILWGGWFATSVLAFGMASSTTTHPYYLVGVAVPLAAVLGIGFSLLWKAFRRGDSTSWLLPAGLVGCAVYQIYGSRGMIGDWSIGLVMGSLLLSTLIMAIAIWKKLTVAPLSIFAARVGTFSVLVPLSVLAITAGEQITVPTMPNMKIGPARPINTKEAQVKNIASFINEQGDSGSIFAVGTVNARDAAPFIIAGVPAISIGGFSGSDPVFSITTFRAMVERGELRYFLMPFSRTPPGRPRDRSSQDTILRNVRLTWDDLSQAVGLPSGSLYRYKGQPFRP